MTSDENLELFWGTLPRSLLTLYMAITGGLSWHVALAPLDEVSSWLIFPFIFYIAFAILAMMNVITGVFVESALLNAKADREKEVRDQVRTLFQHADEESGEMGWSQFEKCLEHENMAKVFDALGVDVSEARGLFLLLDADESGSVDFEEFLGGCMKLHGNARAIDLETLMYFNKRMLKWWTQKIRVLEDSLLELSPTGKIKAIEQDRLGKNNVLATWSEVVAAGNAA
eukprot:CAMPEP_0197682786 /NCGR_PEP_ID=MMETSP1338-20131121/96983_1 /TAXON_ID=43686 ORGANISM="Pelagodinium beii, Strain RCC1491" /NCGR_SAMPLE_ID=MMETSP1338 /ASSEMBLY_ACC=CAM_ASM_000754 /LENGTH=227 /DNA_ID=CAMNT_0043264287 /DNA_START=362 /DNA_END=1045 /DNA_ORIENTATION=-